MFVPFAVSPFTIIIRYRTPLKVTYINKFIIKYYTYKHCTKYMFEVNLGVIVLRDVSRMKNVCKQRPINLFYLQYLWIFTSPPKNILYKLQRGFFRLFICIFTWTREDSCSSPASLLPSMFFFYKYKQYLKMFNVQQKVKNTLLSHGHKFENSWKRSKWLWTLYKISEHLKFSRQCLLNLKYFQL